MGTKINQDGTKKKSLILYLVWTFFTLPKRSTWPAAYCSITSLTSYGLRASLNLRLATKYFIWTRGLDVQLMSKEKIRFFCVIKKFFVYNFRSKIEDKKKRVTKCPYTAILGSFVEGISLLMIKGYNKTDFNRWLWLREV